MSLFNQNKTSEETGADDNRLREWGDAERIAPPVRRGSFANLLNRFTDRTPATGADKPVSWLRPVLAMGLASCVTLSVAVRMMDEQKARAAEKEAVEAARTEREYWKQVQYKAKHRKGSGANQALYLADRKREIAEKRRNLGAWGGRALFDFGNGVAARCAPVFVDGDTATASVGTNSEAVVPFSVAIRNTGAAFGGTITVSIGETGTYRVYKYPVQIAGNGATYRQTLYPRLGYFTEDSRYKITLQTPFKTVELDNGIAHQVGWNRASNLSRAARTLAVLDTRIGTLSPRSSAKDRPVTHNIYITETGKIYGKPQFAPDHAIGYEAVDTLVLGYGCEMLTAAQWNAIREWVKDGGSLVMLGGSPEMRRVLATPAALELSPALSFATETRSTTPHRRVSYADNGSDPLRKGFFLSDGGIPQRFPETMTTLPTLKPDARTIYESPMLGKTHWASIAAVRTLGAGSVSVYGFDPTTDDYRDDPYLLPQWWGGVGIRQRGAVASGSWNRYLGNHWDRQGYDRTPGEHNPFYTQFPDLSLVMYVFLGYFVLVVPVSFVVLKQTRRLNYAWFTAPTLAAVCAGGLAFTTRDLYSAPQSVRTSGVLALEGGDPVARFHGQSELYTPKAGRYTLTLPGTGQTFGSLTHDVYHSNNDECGCEGNYNTLVDNSAMTQTVDTGSGENPPVVEMGNLSFKRINHEQTVTLGTGITASLRADTNGNMKGTLTNGTGRTLRNVRVRVRGENIAGRTGVRYLPVWKYDAVSVAPGTRNIVLYASINRAGERVNMGLNTELFRGNDAAWFAPRTPFLTAQIDGKPFAPQGFGRLVGGENSVTVIAKLPAVPQAAMPEVTSRMYEGEKKTASIPHFRIDDTPPGSPPPPGFPPPAGFSATAQGDNR